MLIELLWPKELKKLIKKYKDEGTLNEVAIKNIEEITYRYFLAFAIASLMFIFASKYKIGISLLVFSPLLIKIDLHRMFYNQFAPYILGKKTKAKFKKITTSYGHGFWATYEIFSKKKIFCRILGPGTSKYKMQPFPKKNQMAYVYQSNKHKNKGMPDIQFYKQKCSLTTSIL